MNEGGPPHLRERGGNEGKKGSNRSYQQEAVKGKKGTRAKGQEERKGGPSIVRRKNVCGIGTNIQCEEKGGRGRNDGTGGPWGGKKM